MVMAGLLTQCSSSSSSGGSSPNDSGTTPDVKTTHSSEAGSHVDAGVTHDAGKSGAETGTDDAGTAETGTKPDTGVTHEAGAAETGTQPDTGVTHEAGTAETGTQPDTGVAHDAAGQHEGGDAAPTSIHLAGALAKGPFLQGSSVVVSPTDALGNPTSANFQTSTTDNLGDFALTFTYQGPVLLTGTGFYFNEAEGALSGAQISLKSFAEVTQSGSQNAYVNLITHLAFNREQTLVATMPFAQAVTQAETELRGQLGVGGASFNPGAAGSQLNLLSGDTVEAAYLFAVGSVFAEAAQLSTAAGSEDAKLQQLVNTTASALATAGTLPTATVASLALAQQCIEPDNFMASLQANFTSNAATTAVPNINRALDSDLDGIPNLTDNCPLVANPAQAAVTNGICNYQRGATTPSATNNQGGTTLTADLDGAHGADLVSFGLNEIDSWLNDGTGKFGSAVVTSAATAGLTTYAGASILGLAMADMNGDTHPDIVAALAGHGGPGQVPVVGYLAGDGAGHFGTFTTLFTFGDGTGSCNDHDANFIVVDLNADGRPDVAAQTGCSNGGVAVALAPASGAWSGFAAPIAFPVPNGVTGSAPFIMDFKVADMNEDGKPDLIVAVAADGITNVNYGGVATFFGAGNGTFPTSSTYTSTFGINAYAVSVGDVDRDHHKDLVVAVGTTNQNGAGTTTVGFGSGTGTITASTTIASTTTGGPDGVSVCPFGAKAGGGPMILATAVADFTGDGKQDIVVSQGRTVATPIPIILSSGGTGGAFATSFLPIAVDLNGDGISDYAGFGNGGYVLFNLASYHSW